jgi:pimeloyl-ACP methyl ester carboxylesterase
MNIFQGVWVSNEHRAISTPRRDSANVSKAGKFWKTLIAGGAGVAALAAVNAKIKRQAREPDEAVFGGEPRQFNWKHGRVFYKAAGLDKPGTPILFVHGIGAGVSSFTWRKNFDELAGSFPVYALDLLGFGLSDKPSSVPYSASLFSELLADFVRDVTGAPVNVVASSLGAAYAVCSAFENPELVSSLVLVSPTGVGNLSSRPGVTGAAFYGLLQSPVLGTSFYNVVASERSIRDYAAKQLFFDKRRVTERFVANHYATSHLPGAQHAIAAFLSGFLNFDIREPFSGLTQPVTIVWGREDVGNPLANAGELLQVNPRATLEIFDHARMLPHEEHPQKFNNLLRDIFGQTRQMEARASHRA